MDEVGALPGFGSTQAGSGKSSESWRPVKASRSWLKESIDTETSMNALWRPEAIVAMDLYSGHKTKVLPSYAFMVIDTDFKRIDPTKRKETYGG